MLHRRQAGKQTCEMQAGWCQGGEQTGELQARLEKERKKRNGGKATGRNKCEYSNRQWLMKAEMTWSVLAQV